MKMIKMASGLSESRPASLVRFACLAGLLLMAACTQTAPPFTFSPAQVQVLKENGSDPLRLGTFTAGEHATGVTGITLRSATLASPYGDYPSYLKEALRQELDEAGRLAPNAAIEVSGVMTSNNLNTGLAVTGEGELEARIIVKRGEATLYNKSLLAKTTWDTSFVGAVAIPRAITEYPRLVSEFIAVLLRDPDFLAAIK